MPTIRKLRDSPEFRSHLGVNAFGVIRKKEGSNEYVIGRLPAKKRTASGELKLEEGESEEDVLRNFAIKQFCLQVDLNVNATAKDKEELAKKAVDQFIIKMQKHVDEDDPVSDQYDYKYKLTLSMGGLVMQVSESFVSDY